MRIKEGKGVMPSFEMIGEDKMNQIVDFLTKQEKDTIATDGDWPYPYNYHGHRRFDLEDGYPMIKPPWVQLTAID
ncbi:hypothetical protein [Confluentibacter flavum]|uniref:Cytochrome c domain-containing protein n=1 Tax=Confluentibacter flavum TaxID=1909700 RepID=A0A2N3HKH6_9FLAO|nr:hypothetical protein [Confluentibacter flavum]PKQ45394.1 hypothetical protein CSW08_08510 [Confluentibacter flavum]